MTHSTFALAGVAAVAVAVVAAMFGGAAITVGNAGANVPEPCYPPPANLISWWTGDDTAADFADGNTGTLNGDATYVDGMVGRAFSFDGDGDFVFVGLPFAADNLDITGDVTVDLWARRTEFGGNATLVSKGVGFAPKDYPSAYILRFDNDKLRGIFERTSATNVVVTGPTVTDKDWHHYAYVRKIDPDPNPSGDGTHALFMDGALVPGSPVAFTGPVGSALNLPLTIGAQALTDAPTQAEAKNQPFTFTNFFDGEIDEVEVFNRALPNSDISEIFSHGNVGKCKPAALSVVGGIVELLGQSESPGDASGSSARDYTAPIAAVAVAVVALAAGGWYAKRRWMR